MPVATPVATKVAPEERAAGRRPPPTDCASMQMVTVVNGQEAIVDFGDWNGRPVWLPLIVR
jgi:hypothetical protein